MRYDYTPIKKGKKVQRAPPQIQKRKIDKPIVMPQLVIATPFFVL